MSKGNPMAEQNAKPNANNDKDPKGQGFGPMAKANEKKHPDGKPFNNRRAVSRSFTKFYKENRNAIQLLAALIVTILILLYVYSTAISTWFLDVFGNGRARQDIFGDGRRPLRKRSATVRRSVPPKPTSCSSFLRCEDHDHDVGGFNSRRDTRGRAIRVSIRPEERSIRDVRASARPDLQADEERFIDPDGLLSEILRLLIKACREIWGKEVEDTRTERTNLIDSRIVSPFDRKDPFDRADSDRSNSDELVDVDVGLDVGSFEPSVDSFNRIPKSKRALGGAAVRDKTHVGSGLPESGVVRSKSPIDAEGKSDKPAESMGLKSKEPINAREKTSNVADCKTPKPSNWKTPKLLDSKTKTPTDAKLADPKPADSRPRVVDLTSEKGTCAQGFPMLTVTMRVRNFSVEKFKEYFILSNETGAKGSGSLKEEEAKKTKYALWYVPHYTPTMEVWDMRIERNIIEKDVRDVMKNKGNHHKGNHYIHISNKQKEPSPLRYAEITENLKFVHNGGLAKFNILKTNMVNKISLPFFSDVFCIKNIMRGEEVLNENQNDTDKITSGEVTHSEDFVLDNPETDLLIHWVIQIQEKASSPLLLKTAFTTGGMYEGWILYRDTFVKILNQIP